MPTDDLSPLALPDGWSPLEQGRDSPEIVSLSDSFDLDEFASEDDDGSASPRSEPIVERALTTAAEPPGAADADAVTLFDLFDRRDAMDWREAVAVVHGLCVQLKDYSPEHPVVLDPRNVLLTADGEIRVMRGPPGGDPLVIQIGRLLRTLLLNKPVPPEVRLILSQATFEVPIFDSVEDVARALGQVSTMPRIDGVGLAHARAMGPSDVTHPVDTVGALLPAPRPMLPAPRRSNRFLLARLGHRKDDALLIATALVGAAVCVALIVAGSTQNHSAPVQIPAALRAPAVDVRAMPGPVASVEASSASPDTPALVAPLPKQPSAPTRRAGPASQPIMTLDPGGSAEPEVTLSLPRPARPSEAVPASPRDTERRATALVKAGKLPEADIAFDALVLNNPLYEPTRTEMTPEAYAAFQASRKILLPGIAIRDFGRAKAALEQGNVDRALALATVVEAVLDRAEPHGPPGLRAQVRILLDQALEAQTAEEEQVYTGADPDVVAPLALSRQFPLSSPTGIRPDRLGVLQIVVGKQGEVEFVKLHTPLNRYHERMVVSAAKAWRYRPAQKGGKPVRYRLTVTINLPESGV